VALQAAEAAYFITRWLMLPLPILLMCRRCELTGVECSRGPGIPSCSHPVGTRIDAGQIDQVISHIQPAQIWCCLAFPQLATARAVLYCLPPLRRHAVTSTIHPPVTDLGLAK